MNHESATPQELAHAEERMRSVVNHVVDGIISIDEAGVITTFNPAAERIFGYAADEVIGKNVRLLMPEPYHSEHDGYIANYLQTGKAKIIGIGREVVGRRKDGAIFPMELAISVFRLGGRPYFTGIVRDITERKRAEEELRPALYQILRPPPPGGEGWRGGKKRRRNAMVKAKITHAPASTAIAT